MKLNSNRKNVAKIVAAASSAVLFSCAPTYQLNGVEVDFPAVENLRDALKSNAFGGTSHMNVMRVAFNAFVTRPLKRIATCAITPLNNFVLGPLKKLLIHYPVRAGRFVFRKALSPFLTILQKCEGSSKGAIVKKWKDIEKEENQSDILNQGADKPKNADKPTLTFEKYFENPELLKGCSEDDLRKTALEATKTGQEDNLNLLSNAVCPETKRVDLKGYIEAQLESKRQQRVPEGFLELMEGVMAKTPSKTDMPKSLTV